MFDVEYPAEVRNHVGKYAEPMVFLSGRSGCVCVNHITGWTDLAKMAKG